jgi:hypothetical protein
VTAAHVVSPDDEQRHQPEAEDLWNESYYADFVHEDGSWGGWLRLGLYPNRRVAWWTTWIVGPGRPGVCSVRYDAPVPAGTGLVAEDSAIRIELDIVQPLEQFRIAASAPAEVFEDPAEVYAGGRGRPARLDLDLTWTTDGTPYHYDLTTRYEIPCTTHGTVTIDGETLTVRGQGQRDHSWGVRDWWAFGWCWSSARLDDGTRVHLADIRMPGFPVAFGYVQTPVGQSPASQSPVGDVHTIGTLSVTEDLGSEGMPTSARIELTYGESAAGAGPVGPVGPVGAVDAVGTVGALAIDVTPLAFGPVLLRNDDGRTSRFPRALVRYAAEDGRVGLGWIEWNQPEGG